jgi:hypothetical protein
VIFIRETHLDVAKSVARRRGAVKRKLIPSNRFVNEPALV